MGKYLKWAKTAGGALVGLAIMLIILFWVLNFASKRAPAPISTIASSVEAHANGSAYTA